VITVTDAGSDSVLAAGPAAPTGKCYDYHVERNFKYDPNWFPAGGDLATFYLNKHVCFDGTSVTNPRQEAEFTTKLNNQAQFWGWQEGTIDAKINQA